MTLILQPPVCLTKYGDPEDPPFDLPRSAWEAFAKAPPEERRRILAESRARAEAAARQEVIDKGAEDILLYREKERRANELQVERSGVEDSWLEEDLSDAFNRPQQLPDVGAFILSEKSNGGGVFYSGKLNEVHGQSESGKTMFALAVMAHEIRAEHHVIMVDFEDDKYAIYARLHYIFGLTHTQIVTYLHYWRPAAAFNEKAYDRIKSVKGVTFCLIDAVTEGMAISGLDGRREDEVATWLAEFPKKLARLGMAVCLIDHTPGGDGTRAIGSQHKKAAVDGVSYTAESVKKFTKGRAGQLRIKVAKDKPGGVRPDALPQKDGQEWRGDLRIDGTEDPSHPRVGLWGVEPALLHGGSDGDDSYLDRGVMPGGPSVEQRMQVLAALREGPKQGMSTNALCNYIGGRKDDVRTTLEWMRNDDSLLWVKEGNAIIHGLPPDPKNDAVVQGELE